MASGKQRKHNRNPGGRPATKDLYRRIANLQQIIAHKHHNTATWTMIDRLLTVIDQLEELSTPLQAATYNPAGHTAEQPLIPGVRLADDGAGLEHPDGDGETNKGDRNLWHGGREFQQLNAWLYRHINWTITSVERRLASKEPDPKPQPFRAKTSDIETARQ